MTGVPEAGLEPFVPRITLTLPAFGAARQVVVLASGESKADAVAKAFGPGADARPARPQLDAAAERQAADGAARPRRGGPAMSVVGVDLGGTKVAVAELSGRTLSDPITTPTERDQSAALVDQLVATVGKARGDDLEAVGIGVPSVVDFKSGRVVSSVNIPLADVNLREVLSERLGVPVFLDNDATVAALAEAHDEDLRQVVDDLVMLTIGTGVGGGLVLGGRIYRGATGGAGEIGHTIVALDPGERARQDGREFPAARLARVRRRRARTRPARRRGGEG